jgi:predicted anti-sigma-YlaC factor YlaD
MHRPVEDHLEDVLSGAGLSQDHPALKHLEICEECRLLVGMMREHSALLREWRVPAEVEPDPGFYARVRQRIETQRPVSIWNLVADSMFGRAMATASLALVMLAGAYLVSAERSSGVPTSRGLLRETYPVLPAADFPDEVFAMPASARYASVDFDRGAVLMNLATYREQ